MLGQGPLGTQTDAAVEQARLLPARETEPGIVPRAMRTVTASAYRN
jgi:hypothetical protein